MLGFYPLSANAIGGMPIESNRILEQNIGVSLITDSTLLKEVFLQGEVVFFKTIEVYLDIYRNLFSEETFTLTTVSNLTNIINIRFEQSIDFAMNAQASSYTFIESNSNFKMMAYPILDVDNNTSGQPGGIPVEGFYPPNNVIFVLTHEDSDPITKNITSSIGDFTGYSIQNSDLISVSLIDNVAEVKVKTPYILGARLQQFISTKILQPQSVAYDYTLRFDSDIIQLTQQKFDINGCQNATLILEDGILYAKNDLYFVKIGEVIDSRELVFKNLLITSSDEILIEARCQLEDIPSPEYYQQVINTRVVDDKDQLGSVDLTQSLRTAESEEQFIELSVGQTNVIYKIMVLPNFDIDKNLILETVN